MCTATKYPYLRINLQSKCLKSKFYQKVQVFYFYNSLHSYSKNIDLINLQKSNNMLAVL